MREEALCGLAKRHDTRALPALITELNQAELSDRVYEAAEAFLDRAVEEPRRSPNEYVAALKTRFSSYLQTSGNRVYQALCACKVSSIGRDRDGTLCLGAR